MIPNQIQNFNWCIFLNSLLALLYINNRNHKSKKLRIVLKLLIILTKKT